MVVEVVHSSCMQHGTFKGVAEPRESVVYQISLVSKHLLLQGNPKKKSWENLHCYIRCPCSYKFLFYSVGVGERLC